MSPLGRHGNHGAESRREQRAWLRLAEVRPDHRPSRPAPSRAASEAREALFALPPTRRERMIGPMAMQTGAPFAVARSAGPAEVTVAFDAGLPYPVAVVRLEPAIGPG